MINFIYFLSVLALLLKYSHVAFAHRFLSKRETARSLTENQKGENTGKNNSKFLALILEMYVSQLFKEKFHLMK